MISIKLTATTMKELKGKMKSYLSEYHPCGYGTRFNDPISTGSGWEVAGTRSSSCD